MAKDKLPQSTIPYEMWDWSTVQQIKPQDKLENQLYLDNIRTVLTWYWLRPYVYILTELLLSKYCKCNRVTTRSAKLHGKDQPRSWIALFLRVFYVGHPTVRHGVASVFQH